MFGPAGGVLAAVVYTYTPYHLADAYLRGAVPEHAAFIFPPLILWAFTAAFRSAYAPSCRDASAPSVSMTRRDASAGSETRKSKDASAIDPLLLAPRSPLTPLLWGSLAWVGLVLTHNLTALLMMPVAVAASVGAGGVDATLAAIVRAQPARWPWPWG